MPVTDKNRKILWAQSGNLCAICRKKLVIEKNGKDFETVVGEECHIVASAPNGPRFDPTHSKDQIDNLDNLILLCATHHKMIDDQFETYSVVVLRQIKSNHEKWVDLKLKNVEIIPPIKIRRFEKNIPKHLNIIHSGQALFAMASGCQVSYHNHDPDLSDQEVELVGGFFQEVKDWTDLSSELEPLDQLRAGKRIDDLLQELKAQGFLVFAGTELQRLEGGVAPPSNWKAFHLSILRSTNPSIILSEKFVGT